MRDTALLGRLLRFKLDDSFRLSHRFLLLFLAPPYLSSYNASQQGGPQMHRSISVRVELAAEAQRAEMWQVIVEAGWAALRQALATAVQACDPVPDACVALSLYLATRGSTGIARPRSQSLLTAMVLLEGGYNPLSPGTSLPEGIGCSRS